MELLKPLYLSSLRLYLDSADMSAVVRVIFLVNFGFFFFGGYRRRSLLNLFQVVAFPFLVCMMLRNLSRNPAEAGTILFVFAVFCILLGAYLAAGLLQRMRRRAAMNRKRRSFLLRSGIGGARGLLTVWLLFSCMLASLVTAAGGDADTPELSGEEGEREIRSLWNHNQDRLYMLCEENFSGLTEEEKLRVLQAVVELEMIGFGIDKVELSAVAMGNENEAGYYDVGASLIVISDRLLKEDAGVALCLDTILHECYHAYELSCILEQGQSNVKKDPQMHERILMWQEDLQSYRTVGDAPSWEEYMAYYGQSVEEDARTYATVRGACYRAYIEQLKADGK